MRNLFVEIPDSIRRAYEEPIGFVYEGDIYMRITIPLFVEIDELGLLERVVHAKLVHEQLHDSLLIRRLTAGKGHFAAFGYKLV